MRKCGDGGGRWFSLLVRVDAARIASRQSAGDCGGAEMPTSVIT